MELIWSTATFRPSNSKTWSASLVWFSNAMWYWKPEQPPPTTATRRATGTGLCMLMISLTLVIATAVKSIIISLGLRSRAYPRSYQHLHYTRTFIRLRNPTFLSLNAWYHRISTSMDASLTIRCNDHTQGFPYPRRRNRARSSRRDPPRSGSHGRADRLGRDRRTLRQVLQPGNNRQPGRRGIRAQGSSCAQRPYGHGHRRRHA